MRQVIAVLLATALAGSAVAQTVPKPAAIPATAPPAPLVMPPDIAKLGDADAICFVASANMAAIMATIVASAPANAQADRQKLDSFAQHQIAFAIGRLSGRVGDERAQTLANQAAKAYVRADTKIDKRPTMSWCLHNQSSQVNAFPTYMNAGYKIAQERMARGRDTPKMEAVDPDSLCLVLMGIALPGTIERAKQGDARAHDGVNLLEQTQAYYMGRTLSKARTTPIDQTLADAVLSVTPSYNAGDETTLMANARRCTSAYSVARVALFQAASKGTDTPKTQ
jgi:hypothetical protein